MKEKSNTTRIVVAIAVLALIIIAVAAIGNLGASKPMSAEDAQKKLDSLYSRLYINRLPIKQDPDFLLGDESETVLVLPDISEYPFIVNPSTGDFLTIYASPDKAEWLRSVADKFNQSGPTVDGRPVSVGIRIIPSGVAADLISSGKYTPDIYAPASSSYGDLILAKGTNLRLVEGKLAKNVSGLVISKKKSDELKAQYGTESPELDNIIDSVFADTLSLGYASPSSDENGFLFVLELFSGLGGDNPFGEESIERLRLFQDKILFLAYESEQLKSALASGILDAAVLDYQSYINSPALGASYEFLPLCRRDGPLYQVGDIGDFKSQITTLFVEFCKSADSQKAASDLGFNNLDSFAKANLIEGADVLRAREVYDREKNGSSAVTAVFVADISGSMEGSPMLNLKASLYRAIDVIDSNANIGLVTFANEVNIAVPIAKFDQIQKSCFSSAVKNMTAGGGTAMFDAIVAAQKMLLDEKAKNPGTKLLLFVLTDGEANLGYTFKDIEKMTKGLNIPIYTIGYNANIEVLQKLSEINEAAAMNADSDNIIYRLESLFRSQT